MPASALTTRQIWQVAAYVRELGHVAGSKPKSDPRRGQQIFSTKGVQQGSTEQWNTVKPARACTYQPCYRV